MYKNVSNQHIIALILLFSSCFITRPASAQYFSARQPDASQINNRPIPAGTNQVTPTSSATTVSNPDVQTGPSQQNLKNADADTAWKPVRRLWGYAFGDFYYDAHSK